MKIIAVMNQKGGIGKTMTAAAIAYIMGEEKGKKVLICDADQQGNISLLYDRFDPEGQGMSELLENHQAAGGAYSTTDLIRTTPYGNIDIIPANGYLMRTNMTLLQEEGEDQILRFAAAMNEVRTIYDYCIVDCGLIMDMKDSLQMMTKTSKKQKTMRTIRTKKNGKMHTQKASHRCVIAARDIQNAM